MISGRILDYGETRLVKFRLTKNRVKRFLEIIMELYWVDTFS